jgi:hypothetical protein
LRQPHRKWMLLFGRFQTVQYKKFYISVIEFILPKTAQPACFG